MALVSPTLRRVAGYFRPHTGAMVFASGCALLSGALTTGPVFIVKRFGELLLGERSLHAFAMLGVGLSFIFIAAATAQYGQDFILAAVGLRVVQRLRSELVSRLGILSLDYFADRKAGELTSRVVADTTIVQMATQGLIDSFSEPARMVALMASAVYLAPRLVLVFLPALGIMLLVVGRLRQAIRRYTRRTQERVGQSAGLIAESIAGAREVRGFGLEKHQLARFEGEHDEALRQAMKGARAAAAGPFSNFVLAGIGSGFVIWMGGRLVLHGEMTVPSLLAFLAAIGLTYQPVRKLTRVTTQLSQVSGAAERIFGVLDAPITVPDRGTRAVPPIVDRVAFETVDFAYRERRVLDGVSFEARRGEVVALVGESGAGKTTVLSLLPRFYDVKGGKITLDGTDIRDFTLASLRARIAVVSQDTFLFGDTVEENIRLGRLDASREEIVAAAKAAFAHGFIDALPKGYATMLGERGLGLSGGQRQRIAIARAILRNAPILLLDEATSALDSESEREVQRALETLMHDRVTLVVAHRLSTVTAAHRIVVLAGGKVIEIGSHRELFEQGGEYRRLADLQFRTA